MSLAPSSVAFCAQLPECISDVQMEKVFGWAKSTCVKGDVVMSNGSMYLIAIRQEAKTLREWQRLIHTNLKNWKVAMPAQKGLG